MTIFRLIIGSLLLLPMDGATGLSTISTAEDIAGSTSTKSVVSRPPSNSYTSPSSISNILPPLPKNYQARLYLVRHAETDWNAEGRIQGCSNDIELNDAGRKQAYSMARKHFVDLPIDLIVSSHLKRSKSTASIIRQNLIEQQQPPMVDDGSFFKKSSNRDNIHRIVDGFEEMNFGKLEGITYKRIPTKRKEMWRLFRAAIHVTKTHFIQPQQGTVGGGGGKTERWPGGGESISDVETRVRYGLDYILSLNKNNQETRDQQQHIVVVGHKQTNKILLASLLWNNALQCEQIRQKSTFVIIVTRFACTSASRLTFAHVRSDDSRRFLHQCDGLGFSRKVACKTYQLYRLEVVTKHKHDENGFN